MNKLDKHYGRCPDCDTHTRLADPSHYCDPDIWPNLGLAVSS